MLGTNDLKARFRVGATDIAASVEVLVRSARAYCAARDLPVPGVVVVAPAPIAEVREGDDTWRGGAEKSRRLGPLLREVATRLGTGFVDAGAHVRTSDTDGIHLDADAHRALARAVEVAVRA